MSSQDIEGHSTESEFDTSRFPIVTFRVTRDVNLAHWIARMEELLSREEKFVLIMNGRPHDEGDGPRRERNLWLKGSLDRIQRHCGGIIQVEPDDARRAEQIDHARKMVMAFNVPMEIVPTEQTALELAEDLVRSLAN